MMSNNVSWEPEGHYHFSSYDNIWWSDNNLKNLNVQESQKNMAAITVHATVIFSEWNLQFGQDKI